jgi:hypothetical protein
VVESCVYMGAVHHFVTWFAETFFHVWKPVSIAVTGAFGLLGLLTEFKKKVKDLETDTVVQKITKWGWVSLLGIVVSSVCGVAAQLKESADDASRALVLAEKTDRTLNEIERGLHPLEDPAVTLTFKVPCEEPRYKKFCRHLDLVHKAYPLGVPSYAWRGWPYPGWPLRVHVQFFVDRVKNQEYFPRSWNDDANLSFYVEGKMDRNDSSLEAINFDDGQVQLELSNQRLNIDNNDGAIKSLLDFHGVTLLITFVTTLQRKSEAYVDFNDLDITDFSLKVKDGQEITLTSLGQQLQKRMIYRQAWFVYHFPDK